LRLAPGKWEGSAIVMLTAQAAYLANKEPDYCATVGFASSDK